MAAESLSHPRGASVPRDQEVGMPQGDKSAYTDKQKRKAEAIEDSYEKKGVGRDEAERRAWATVNKQDGGGREGGRLAPEDGNGDADEGEQTQSSQGTADENMEMGEADEGMGDTRRSGRRGRKSASGSGARSGRPRKSANGSGTRRRSSTSAGGARASGRGATD